MLGIYRVEIFVNGCLNDGEQWFDNAYDARRYANTWPATSCDLQWYGPYHMTTGAQVYQAQYPDSPYVLEVTYFPNGAFCDGCPHDGVCKDIYDTDGLCPECYDELQASLDAYERMQP